MFFNLENIGQKPRSWHYLVVLFVFYLSFITSYRMDDGARILFSLLNLLFAVGFSVFFSRGPSILAGIAAALLVDYHFIGPGSILSTWQEAIFFGVSIGLTQLIVGVVSLLRGTIADEAEQRSRAFQAIAARERILGIVAHDLRQPVSTITLLSQLMKRRRLDQSSPDTAKCVDGIQRNISRLNRMIEDLLDFSRIDSGQLKVKLEVFELNTQIENVLEAFRVTHPDAEICLEASQKYAVRADPDRLQQVLINLLTNAIKYGAPGREIRVQLSNFDSMVQVTIVNHGEGIPEDELESIFEVFVRAKTAREGKATGLGFGLYITRGLVELMGGKIRARSVLHGETQFTFTLPRSERALSTSVPAQTAPMQPHG